MERHIFLTVLLVTLLALAVAILIPGRAPEQAINLPWQIERTDGSIRVFGITLGRTSLAEVESSLGEPAEVSMFVPLEGPSVVEAYFDTLTVGGLQGKMVLIVDLSDEELRTAFDRGVRIATLGSGIRKVTLHSEDMAKVKQAPVANITYLPRTNLDEELVARRFGEPALKLQESDKEEVVHWLYPELGLDIAVHAKGKEVLQYVSPEEFEQLIEPLRRKGNPQP